MRSMTFVIALVLAALPACQGQNGIDQNSGSSVQTTVQQLSPCTPDAGPEAVPLPPGYQCACDWDCRLFSDSCNGCSCRGLRLTDPQPLCRGKMVACTRDACIGMVPKCESGYCVARLPPTPPELF
jgi:hypothetical protein